MYIWSKLLSFAILVALISCQVHGQKHSSNNDQDDIFKDKDPSIMEIVVTCLLLGSFVIGLFVSCMTCYVLVGNSDEVSSCNDSCHSYFHNLFCCFCCKSRKDDYELVPNTPFYMDV